MVFAKKKKYALMGIFGTERKHWELSIAKVYIVYVEFYY